MNNNLELLIVAVTLIILAEVTYLLLKLPKSSIKSKKASTLVDTSVLMDGRILGVASSGFIGDTLVIPRSVVGELQFLADNADADKRARARYGLDVVSQLQAMDGVDVELLQDGSRAREGVDNQLLKLAKENNASICTIDYNLNKVAVVEGIKVLNINELAQGLRMAHLPGEQMIIEIVQKGQDQHQGVGYLPDGTMVVVEQTSSQIGQTVNVEVVRSLQTAAGKMMFARKVQAPNKSSQGTATKSAPVSRYNKSNGRQKPSTEKPKPKTTSVTQNKSDRPSSQSEPRRSAPLQRKTKRVDHESNLIKLVENQK
jgi:uncharacterized protein YacL